MGVFQVDRRGAEIGVWGQLSAGREQHEQRQGPASWGGGVVQRMEHGWSARAPLGRAIEINS